MKFYLIGIKGTGMSSLAGLLKDKGYTVIGSDVADYYFTEEKLKSKKIPIFLFDKNRITEDYFYIIGNAFNESNIEVKEVFEKGYYYAYYPDFIENVLDLDIYAIAGTHGKTTTSFFVKSFLNEKCNYIIGDGSGKGFDNDILILEACEYKNHFLAYHPKILLINNIELDHTDFFKSKNQLISSFQSLVEQSDIVLINGDDSNCKKIKNDKLITFGFNKNNDILIKILSTTQKGYYIQVDYDKKYYLKVPFLGIHYIYNFVGAYFMCKLMNQEPSLKNIELPTRRLNIYNFKEAILIDDYAHHPTEIKCLYNTLKKMYPDKKLNVIFQSHTYERTIHFKKEFKNVFKLFDKVYLDDVFSSKREKISLEKQKKVDQIFKKYDKINNLDIKEIKQSNDVWIFLGAGVVHNLIQEIINENE